MCPIRWLQYPTDADKNALARATGLRRMQVANWFINARVRVWRPAIFAMSRELEANKTTTTTTNAAQAARGAAGRSRSRGAAAAAAVRAEGEAQA